MFRLDRSQNRRSHPSGYRPDADVCQLLHPLADERRRQSTDRHPALCRQERHARALHTARRQHTDLRFEIYGLHAIRGRTEARIESG